jgi:hypothetical protein
LIDLLTTVQHADSAFPSAASRLATASRCDYCFDVHASHHQRTLEFSFVPFDENRRKEGNNNHHDADCDCHGTRKLLNPLPKIISAEAIEHGPYYSAARIKH